MIGSALLSTLMGWLARDSRLPPSGFDIPPPAPKVAPRRGISYEAIAQLGQMLKRRPQPSQMVSPFKIAGPENFFPSGVRPGGGQMAMDAEITATYSQLATHRDELGAMAWMGFPYLAELAVRPEFRKITEGLAREMTRKWIEIKNRGDEDKSAKVKALQ